jgi:hypothetical protein
LVRQIVTALVADGPISKPRASCPDAIHCARIGSTSDAPFARELAEEIIIKMVEEMTPPMTTVASGR